MITKRFLDVVFAVSALTLLAPFLLVVLVLLRLTGEGEVFFLQERIGQFGDRFNLYKFATMRKDSPMTGTLTVKDDPRVLPFGKVLRKTKLNELPQLLNIVLGHMSLIGPRPLTPQTFASYTADIRNTVIKVRPGLSGVGSILFRDEETILSGKDGDVMNIYSDIIAPYKGRVEEWYVCNQNLKTYFLAIVLTIWVVVFPRSSFPWRVFKHLPEPPSQLKEKLHYPY